MTQIVGVHGKAVHHQATKPCIFKKAFGNLDALCRVFMAGKAHLDCLCKTAVFEGF
jgi:hypothetical protein